MKALGLQSAPGVTDSRAHGARQVVYMGEAAHLWGLDDSSTTGSLRICDKSEELLLPTRENTTMWECGPGSQELHTLGEKPGISILM